MYSEKGQSLIELLVSLAIALLVLGSLAFAIITSLRNAQFAKNQAQATKLAQEGLEQVRTLRDRNGVVSSTNPPAGNFNDLWNFSLGCSPEINNCYFFLNSSGLVGVNAVDFETILPNFKRQIQIEDSSTDSKKITAIVKWDDLSGTHQSTLTTVLRKL